MKALEVQDLSKSFRTDFLYRKVEVLKSVNINVEKGSIYGFLGPNGAGKTTTIKCILGLLSPDSGEIRLFSKKKASTADRGKIGFLPESPYYYDYLTAKETLELSGKLSSLSSRLIRERSARIIPLVGLSGKENVLLKKFSKGMLQRIGLAQALINDPDFLILDEPFSGLDPVGRKELRDIIMSLKEEGKTIFFSSHILQDMEMMVDDIGILIRGKISREGKLRELVKDSVKFIEVIVSGVTEKRIRKAGFDFSGSAEKLKVFLKNYDELTSFLGFTKAESGEVLSVSKVSYTLEDLFLKEINK